MSEVPASSYVILGCLGLVWLLMGLIAGALAHDKGRGALGGFVWGFVLGPVGILIVALQKPVAPPLKKCRYCAERIKTDALVCRYCGREQNVPAAPLRNA